MQVVLFVTVGILAIIESWMQPWVSIFGVPLPLVLLFFGIGHIKIEHKLLPWLGLWAGLILDMLGLGYFGVNMLFYLSTAWILSTQSIRISPFNKIWTRVGIVILLAFIQPWYILFANRQFDTDYYFNLSVAIPRTAVVAFFSISIVWFLRSRQGEQV